MGLTSFWARRPWSTSTSSCLFLRRHSTGMEWLGFCSRIFLEGLTDEVGVKEARVRTPQVPL